jgi:predicted PurR-regulated permease PerM
MESEQKHRRAEPMRVVNFRNLVFWAVAAYLVLQVVDAIAATLLLFAIAFFFAMVLDPPIRWLDRRGLSRGMSVAVIAVSTLLAIAVAIALAARPLAAEVSDLSRNGTRYMDQAQQRVESWVSDTPTLRNAIQNADLSERIGNVVRNAMPRIGRYSLTLLNGVLSALLVFIITLYTVADPKPLVRGFVMAVPKSRRRAALRILTKTMHQLQNWVRATFWMMLAIGSMSAVGLWALGVPNWFLFALIAGVGEAIPTIGPILSAIPPFVVMLATDPTKAVYVLILYFVIQQLENNLLVPRIMASTMKLHPVSVMFFVVAMGALLGPIGILLATPLCAITKVVYSEFRREERREA